MSGDVPATEQNAAAFGFHGAHDQQGVAFPKAWVVTIGECGSHAVVGAAIGGTVGKGTGEQVLARQLYPRLQEDWLLIADRGFYTWRDWRATADTGAALLWRVSSWVRLPVLELLPDGSYRSVLIDFKMNRDTARRLLIEAARRGDDLDPDQARYVRVIEYEVPDRDGDGTGELITLITTVTDPRRAGGQQVTQRAGPPGQDDGQVIVHEVAGFGERGVQAGGAPAGPGRAS